MILCVVTAFLSYITVAATARQNSKIETEKNSRRAHTDNENRIDDGVSHDGCHRYLSGVYPTFDLQTVMVSRLI